jgi:mRNA interferase YafQ
MREIVLTLSFKQDYKRLRRSGQYTMLQLQTLTEQLANDGILPEKHRDHALTGNWNNYRECHVKPDWLLIYQINEVELILVRTGSHSDLF